MKPQGEAALEMAKVTGFTQRNPHDGESVSEPTDAYLGYDQKNLYVVFVCFDDPGKVRARMSRREDIYDDDQVEVILDTFHDRRRAYAFQTTPLGVQWDAIWTEASREEQTAGHFDTSFDTVWDSRGKVTDRGFVVWMAIPFKSLRFPAAQQQDWGLILYRGITRKTEDSFWPHISLKVEGRLGQAATLHGLEGISPGHSIELIPYGLMRGFRALDTRDPGNPYFQHATAQGQPGMDAKFVIHDHFVVDMTANPDFSQVESEDPQITVNQRYAVYFPEKRPFFLENEDFFRTPLDLFFTRSIGDPSAGIRLTGKDGPYSLGLISADDRSPGLAVRDSSQFSGMRSYFTVARVSRDIFRQSSVGALYTDWECPTTGEFNRIGGVDTHLKFNPNWTLDGQAVTSSSNLTLDCEANLYPFSSGNHGNSNHYAGPAEKLELHRDGLHFTYDGTYNDISPGFVSVPGFINRVDIRETNQEVDYRFRPKKGWVVDWGPSLSARYDFDHSRPAPRHRLHPVPCDSRARTDCDHRAPLRGTARASSSSGFLFLRLLSLLPTHDSWQSGLSRAHQRSFNPDRILQKSNAECELLLGPRREFCGDASSLRGASHAVQPALPRARGQRTGHPDHPSREAAQD